MSVVGDLKLYVENSTKAKCSTFSSKPNLSQNLQKGFNQEDIL